MPVKVDLDASVTTTTSGATKLSVLAHGSTISSHIFAIEVLPRSADGLAPLYRFSHVCSPAELVEFPDEQAEDCPYFRTEAIEMLFDSKTLADQVMVELQKDIQKLVKNYILVNAPGVPYTISIDATGATASTPAS